MIKKEKIINKTCNKQVITKNNFTLNNEKRTVTTTKYM